MPGRSGVFTAPTGVNGIADSSSNNALKGSSSVMTLRFILPGTRLSRRSATPVAQTDDASGSQSPAPLTLDRVSTISKKRYKLGKGANRLPDVVAPVVAAGS